MAEENGVSIFDLQQGKLLKATEKLFYTGMKAYNPFIEEDEALKLMEQYIKEDGDVDEVATFLMGEYQNFFKSPENNKKAKKKAKIITE